MSTSPTGKSLLRGQVISRVHWGATDDEVLAFLSTEHAVEGEEAEAMLGEAHVMRARAVRGKAIMWLLFSLAGILFTGTYFWFQGYVGFFAIGVGPLVMLLVALASWYVFFRSILRLLTGAAPGAAQ
jgi:hypothetical protein